MAPEKPRRDLPNPIEARKGAPIREQFGVGLHGGYSQCGFYWFELAFFLSRSSLRSNDVEAKF